MLIKEMGYLPNSCTNEYKRVNKCVTWEPLQRRLECHNNGEPNYYIRVCLTYLNVNCVRTKQIYLLNRRKKIHTILIAICIHPVQIMCIS